MARALTILTLTLAVACGGDPSSDGGAVDSGVDSGADSGADAGEADISFLAVTFNTGTTGGLAHDSLPADGDTSAHATISDTYYGDGLAWVPAVEAARTFFAEVDPDVIVFQEIFHSDECATVPLEARADSPSSTCTGRAAQPRRTRRVASRSSSRCSWTSTASPRRTVR